MEEVIKDIRFRLRKAMNGIVSASMRQKGVEYKLNFGVSIPEIKKIASAYAPDAALAKWLWAQDVREHKILATLLYPPASFTAEEAENWVNEIRYQEIAEQFCTNLTQYLSFAPALAERWIGDERENVQISGFLLYARLYTQRNNSLSAEKLFAEAKSVIDQGFSRSQRAALLALKRYGRQNEAQAATVLNYFNTYSDSDSKEQQEFYKDLKFEFEYYN
jgi:Predicted DNA alkylation repair enzyme